MSIAILTLIGMLAGAGFYLAKRALDVPQQLARQGREALQDVRRLAEAFRTGSVTTSFTSYATVVSGSSYLQFATLSQIELFERRDSTTLLWGQLALPDVVVEARMPVAYTYYLDLDQPWTLRLVGNTVLVTAPRVQCNTPAIDVSALRFEVREGSVFRDETVVVESLRSGLTAMARLRARQNIGLVREVGRRRTEQFIERWIVNGYSDGAAYRARVVFADEPVSPGPPAPIPRPQ